MTVSVVPAADAAALYAGVHDLPWEQHLGADGTLAVDFTGTSEQITHTLFGAQKVKDAVVDRFRERDGRRPSVDLRNPDLRINVHLAGAEARVSLDLSGESLHKRGYRDESVEAPLKENLAAAVLIRAGWPAIAAAGGPLLDPMCGSGTIAIEAALIAGDIAPGLLRASFGFLRWPRHDAALWERLLAEARARREAGLRRLPGHRRHRPRPVGGARRARQRRARRPRGPHPRRKARTRGRRAAEEPLRRRRASWRPTRRTASASGRRRSCARSTRPSAPCCGSASRAGRPRCSPATRGSRCAPASARRKPTRSSTARSSAGSSSWT